MSSLVQLPSPDDNYAAPLDARLNTAFWDAALTSVGARIRALEAVKATWEELVTQGTGQALEVIAANVEPQLAVLTTTINQLKADVALAQDVIASIVTGSVPASAVSETASRIWLTPALRDAWNAKQAGDPTLSALAALDTAADKLIYATGADTFALATMTAFAREVLASGTSADFRLAIAAAGADETAKALATKASKRNRHINPAFQICQDRSADVAYSMSSTGYVFDGVAVSLAGGAVIACTKVRKDTPGGSPFRLRLAVTTPDTALAAADRCIVNFPIDGGGVADLDFGTPAAKSFCWRGVVNFPAGTYGLGFSNNADNRSYVTSFTISPAEANTDKLITVVVPPDITGTWVDDITGIGLKVYITISAGTTYRTTPETWQAGNFVTTAEQTNGLASTANVFEFADIGLYVGSEIPDWEMPSRSDDLLKCRSYWRQVYGALLCTGASTVNGAIAVSDIGDMRPTTPAISVAVTPGWGWSGAITGTYAALGAMRAVQFYPSTAQQAGAHATFIATINLRL